VEIVLCIFSRGISNVKNIFCVSQIMSEEEEESPQKRLKTLEEDKRKAEVKLDVFDAEIRRLRAEVTHRQNEINRIEADIQSLEKNGSINIEIKNKAGLIAAKEIEYANLQQAYDKIAVQIADENKKVTDIIVSLNTELQTCHVQNANDTDLFKKLENENLEKQHTVSTIENEMPGYMDDKVLDDRIGVLANEINVLDANHDREIERLIAEGTIDEKQRLLEIEESKKEYNKTYEVYMDVIKSYIKLLDKCDTLQKYKAEGLSPVSVQNEIDANSKQRSSHPENYKFVMMETILESKLVMVQLINATEGEFNKIIGDEKNKWFEYRDNQLNEWITKQMNGFRAEEQTLNGHLQSENARIRGEYDYSYKQAQGEELTTLTTLRNGRAALTHNNRTLDIIQTRKKTTDARIEAIPVEIETIRANLVTTLAELGTQQNLAGENVVQCRQEIQVLKGELTTLENSDPNRARINELQTEIAELDIASAEQAVNEYDSTSSGEQRLMLKQEIEQCKTNINRIREVLRDADEKKEIAIDAKRRQRMSDLVLVNAQTQKKNDLSANLAVYDAEYAKAKDREAKDKVYEKWQYGEGLIPAAVSLRGRYIKSMKEIASLDEMGIVDTFDRKGIISQMGITSFIVLYENYIKSKKSDILNKFMDMGIRLSKDEKDMDSSELIAKYKTLAVETAVNENVPSSNVRDSLKGSFITPFKADCDKLIKNGDSIQKRIERFKVEVEVEAEYQKMSFLFPENILGEKHRAGAVEEWNSILVATLPWDFPKPTKLPVIWPDNIKAIMNTLRGKSNVNLKFAAKYIDAKNVDDIYMAYYRLINKEVTDVHLDELLSGFAENDALKRDCINEMRFFDVKYTDAKEFAKFITHTASPPLPHEYFWYIHPLSSTLTNIEVPTMVAVVKYERFLRLVKKYFEKEDYESVVVDKNYYYYESIYQIRQYEIEELYFTLVKKGKYRDQKQPNRDEELSYLYGMLLGMSDPTNSSLDSFLDDNKGITCDIISKELEKVKNGAIMRPIPFIPGPRVFPSIQYQLKPPDNIAPSFKWYSDWYSYITNDTVASWAAKGIVAPDSVEKLMADHLIPLLKSEQIGDARSWGYFLYAVFRNIYEVNMKYELKLRPYPLHVNFIDGDFYAVLRNDKILPLKKIRGSYSGIKCNEIPSGESGIWKWFMHFYNFDNNLDPMNKIMIYPTEWNEEITKVKTGGDLLFLSNVVDAFEQVGVYCFYQLAFELKTKMNDRRGELIKVRDEARKFVNKDDDTIHAFITGQVHYNEVSVMKLFYLHRMVVDSYIDICHEIFAMDVQKYKDSVKSSVPADNEMINLNDVCNYKNAIHYLPVYMSIKNGGGYVRNYNRSQVNVGSIIYIMTSVYGVEFSENFGSVGKDEFKRYVTECFERVKAGEDRAIIREDIFRARKVIHNNALDVLCDLVSHYKPIRIDEKDSLEDVNNFFIRLLIVKEQSDFNMFFRCMLLLESKRREYVYRELKIPCAMSSENIFKCHHASVFEQDTNIALIKVRNLFFEFYGFDLPYVNIPIVEPAEYIRVIDRLKEYDIRGFSLDIRSVFVKTSFIPEVNYSDFVKIVTTVKRIVTEGTLSEVLSCIHDLRSVQDELPYTNLGDILSAMLHVIDWKRFTGSTVLWMYHSYIDMFFYSASSCDVLYHYHQDMLKDDMEMEFNKMVELSNDSNMYYHQLFVYVMLQFYVQFKYEEDKGFNSALTWEKTRIYLNCVMFMLLGCVNKKTTFEDIIKIQRPGRVATFISGIRGGTKDFLPYKALFGGDILKSLGKKKGWEECYEKLNIVLPKEPVFQHDDNLGRYTYYTRYQMVKMDFSIFKRETNDDFLVEFLVQSRHILMVFGLTTEFKYAGFLEASTLLYSNTPSVIIAGIINKLNTTVADGSGVDSGLDNLLQSGKQAIGPGYKTSFAEVIKLVNRTKTSAVNSSFFQVVQHVSDNINNDRMGMINTLMKSKTSNLYHFLLCDILNTAGLKVPLIPPYKSLEDVDNIMSSELRNKFTMYDGLCEVYSTDNVMKDKCRKYILYSLYRMSEIHKGEILGYNNQLPEINGMNLTTFHKCNKSKTMDANKIILSENVIIDTITVVKSPINLMSQLKAIIRDERYTIYGLHFQQFVQFIDNGKDYDKFENIGRVCKTHILVEKIKAIMADFVKKLETRFDTALWGCYDTLLSEMETFDEATVQRTNIHLNNYYRNSIRFGTSQRNTAEDDIFDGLLKYTERIKDDKGRSNTLQFLGFFVYEYGELLKRELIKRLFRIEAEFKFSHKDMLLDMLKNFKSDGDLVASLNKYYVAQKKYYGDYVGASEIMAEKKKNPSWTPMKFNIYDGKNSNLSQEQIKLGFCDAFLRSMEMFEDMSSKGKVTKKVYSENTDFVVNLLAMHQTYSSEKETFCGVLQKYINDTKEVVYDDNDVNPKAKKTDTVKLVAFDVSLTLLARYTSFSISQAGLYYTGNEREAVQYLEGAVKDYETIFKKIALGEETTDSFINRLKNETDVVKKEINITLLCYKFISLQSKGMKKLFNAYVNRVLDKKKDDEEKDVPLQFDFALWPKLKKKMDDHGGSKIGVTDPQIQEINMKQGDVRKSILKFFSDISLSQTRPVRTSRIFILTLNKKKIEENDVDNILDITPTFCSLAPYYFDLEEAMKSVEPPNQSNINFMADMLTRNMSLYLYQNSNEIPTRLNQMETERIQYINDNVTIVGGEDVSGYDSYKQWCNYYRCEKFKIFLILSDLDDLSKEQFDKKWTDDEKKIESFKDKNIVDIAKSYRDLIKKIVRSEEGKKIEPVEVNNDAFPKPIDNTVVVFPGDFGVEISFTKSKDKNVRLYTKDNFMDVVKYVKDNLNVIPPGELIGQLDANYGAVDNPWVYVLRCVIARRSKLAKSGDELTHEFLVHVATMLKLDVHAKTLEKKKGITNEEYIEIFNAMITALKNKRGSSEITTEEKKAIIGIFDGEDSLRGVESTLNDADSALFPHKDLLKEVCKHMSGLYDKWGKDKADARKYRQMSVIMGRIHKT